MARYRYKLRSVAKGSPRLARITALLNLAEVSDRTTKKALLLQVVREYEESFHDIRSVRRIGRNTRLIMECLVNFVTEEGYDERIRDAWVKMANLSRRLI